MTHRRDKGLSHDGCIAGLRMERDFAALLSNRARRDAGGNVAELTRYMLRRQLGYTHEQANGAEEQMVGTIVIARGLRGDKLLGRTIQQYMGRTSLDSRSAAVRHLLRLALGYEEDESMRREAGFSAIASARHGLHGVFKGAGE